MKYVRVTQPDEPITVPLIESGSIFSHPSFTTLWTVHDGTPVWWTAYDADTPVAIIPGVEFGRRPVTRFQAMPDGCYVDVIGDGELVRLLDAIRADGYFKGFVYDFNGRFPLLPGVTIDEYATRVIDVSAPEYEPPDSNLRSEIRKAEREGVVIRTIDSERDLDRVLSLAHDSAEHHGQSPRYSDGFYSALAGMAADLDLVRWYVAEHDGAVIASHIYLVHHEQLLYWQSYVDRDAAQLRPNQLIMHEAIGQARAMGQTRLNMGATPADADGLRFYKARWGGEEVRYRCLRWQSLLGRLL